jgi:hypothetical protein
MSFLAPFFLAAGVAIAVPILVHLIQRERKNIVEFPSLMFIRRIPYQSVERRRIHNWWLLLMRIAAMLLLVAAFARPFFHVDPVKAAALMSGAREVVILLDRSASMGYGDHWKRAQDEARKVARSIGGADKATLILFGTGSEEAVRATSDVARLEQAIGDATVSSDATRYAPALRLAQSLLDRSNLPRKEAVLISDFQKSGWERQEEIKLPEGATLTPISVASVDTASQSVSSVKFQRTSFSGEERVMVTAGITNRSTSAVKDLPVKLEIDGRLVDTRNVSVEPAATASVTFPAITVANQMRATVRAGTDALPKDNEFHFALSPSRPVSVLLIQAEGASQLSSFFLSTALSIGVAPPFKVDVLSPSRVTAASFQKRSLVILNDTSTLATEADNALKTFVTQGGGLFLIIADRSPWNSGEMPLLPGRLNTIVERKTGGGGTLGFLDHSHPVFDDFKDPRNGNFTTTRFFKYRTLNPTPADKVLARFDDGAVAMAERTVGSGHVIAFMSTMDNSWNNFPNQHLFLPLVHEVSRYLAQYAEPEAWYTVGRMLDVSVPMAAIVREGAAGDTAGTARKPSGVVMAPSGEQVTVGEGGVQAVELAEQGFYSVRLQGLGERRPFQVAVNLDPAESDLTPLPPGEFVASATGKAAVTATGESLENATVTPEDVEKKQAVWWYLFAAGAALLLGEAVVANRLSKRFGFGLS